MLYAIKHLNTGNYLPQDFKGASHWAGVEFTDRPRLFSKTGAKAFQSSWARGPVVKDYIGDELGHEGFGHYPMYEYRPEPIGRKKSDLAIVPVVLTFGEPLKSSVD